MKLKSLSLSVLAALSLGVATSAMAADATATDANTVATQSAATGHWYSGEGHGWWIGGALGMGYVGNGDEGVFGGQTNAPSVKLDAGYDFNQYVGVYGSYDFMYDLGNADMHIGTLGVKGNLPLTQKLSAFGKVGASYIYVDGQSLGHQLDHLHSDSFSATAGLGLSYQITNALSTQVGADYYQNLDTTNGHADLTQAYWGMTYKFGQPVAPAVITNEVEVVKEVAVQTATRSTYVLPYQNGQTKLNDYGRYNLNEVVATMNANPEVTAQIVGRTDSVGSKAINEKVSNARAQGVAEYLEANGIDASRLTVSSVANSDPLVAGNSNGANLIERSVQIILK
ncbi:OmpA family protein [Photobacterium damselae]|uniref:OmpA family protein n=1 Tax=Photobacterium damselae TaxID=38293 RepID=UPI0010FD4DBC|nr:OmpA family protein [Photobacterium damselae]ELV7518428.1 OmpA family protein [Photobacterium damselae]MBA5684805.1 OmpA family protein [Photobacterium damselae subsp. damselae]MCG3813961.1 OmpA family protein [Photobacterium damselae]NVH52556.1 OmpA family protein [Photobacterium damselae subsp. damselae]NVO82906.1 OmpA family protein [Photobacterium damselae subsp. damselae]